VFSRGKNANAKDESQAMDAELVQQIGRRQMELEWLKNNLSSSHAPEQRKLVDHDHPERSISRQDAPLGLARSTLHYRPTPVCESTLRIMARIDALDLEDPCRGIRRMVDYPANKGNPNS
jgi:putative transposase